MAAPTRCSVKIVKHTGYRGNNRQWSNRYFFDTAFSTQSEFDNLANLITTNEKLCVTSGTTFESAVGYNAGSDVPVYTLTLSGTGSLGVGSDYPAPGDCAAMVKFGTTQRTSKNHPIYLWKWYHDAYRYGAGTRDELSHNQRSALETWAQDLVDGLVLDGNTYKYCGPRGAVAQNRVVDQFIRHRDFVN